MRFWTLTVLTLVLAGDALAQSIAHVSANTEIVRRMRIESIAPDEANQPGEWHMEFFLIAENEPGTQRIAPLIPASTFEMSAVMPTHLINPFFGNQAFEANREARSGEFYALYVTVAGNRRRVMILQPGQSSFNSFTGSFSTKGYLADFFEQGLWGVQAMTKEVTVELVEQNLDGDEIRTLFEGTFPRNDL